MSMNILMKEMCGVKYYHVQEALLGALAINILECCEFSVTSYWLTAVLMLSNNDPQSHLVSLKVLIGASKLVTKNSMPFKF